MPEVNHKQRRTIIKGSLTRLGTKLRDLEARVGEDDVPELVRQMKKKLDSLAADFKTHHYAIIDTISDDDETGIEREQMTLDEHDDIISDMIARIQKLQSACKSSLSPDSYRVNLKKLQRIERGLDSIGESCEGVPHRADDDKPCLLQQLEEQLLDYKKDISDTRTGVLSLELDELDPLPTLQDRVERLYLDRDLQVRKLVRSLPHNADTVDPATGKGVKLPKLDVPKFDGNILNWKSFWDQFSVSVHDRSHLSDSEKLVYLQHALKDGSAKHVIDGLTRSGEYYAEAVECLQARFDRPRLIHQTHVRMILDTPSLKDGNGRELRRLHDTVQQHLRALKAMSYEPSGPFITSVLELKLDSNTLFEWQKHSQDANDVPHYNALLEFIDLRAQASESLTVDSARKSNPGKRFTQPGKPIASFSGSVDTSPTCILCESEKHFLYACPKFKAMPHDKMVSTLKANKICMNCLRPHHFVKQCKSHYRCRKCQWPHHTLLHFDSNPESKCAADTHQAPTPTQGKEALVPISSHATMGIRTNMLLMTCCVQVEAPDGSFVIARALLDSASSASFISERLAQTLNLPRFSQSTQISGVAGLKKNSPLQSITNFSITTSHPSGEKINITAIVTPRVTCDLPLQPVPFDLSWDHLSGIQLADPEFGTPGRVDLLLGVEVFAAVMLNGRRLGPSGSPIAFETKLGWVLAGSAGSCVPAHCVVVSNHVSLLTGDDILRKFWELEDKPTTEAVLSPEEYSVVQHFNTTHTRNKDGRFVVPLPKKPDMKLLGESRSQAVRRFHSLERSLHAKGQFAEVASVVNEYFTMKHAEPVPFADMDKPPSQVFYLPMHVVRKNSSVTTKIRAVFDASAKSSTGVSLNDILLVGPTVHSSIIDVLLRFRLYRVALTTDVSRMYRGIELDVCDRDLHRFVWRESPTDTLNDYRMTRVTFGVSASSFASNMSVKQNALDFAVEFPLAYNAVRDNFYVDDGLTGADSVEEAIKLCKQLHCLFGKADLLLHKWNSSDPQVLEHIPTELRDPHSVHQIAGDSYTKALGIEWNPTNDHFRLTVADLLTGDCITKRILVSDIAKTFDVLGWFSPTIIKMKILLQKLWELKVGWDDVVPSSVRDIWLQWRSELELLSGVNIPRCYYPKNVHIATMQLHGFSDASERAYAGVVYLRITDSEGGVHVSLVTSKTKVAPIKRLTIPRLELCGAHILAQLLHHVKEVFGIPMSKIHAWTDSTIVVNWLIGDPRRFKTYVGNRVSQIVDLISPECWHHVSGVDNPADCASRGLLPSELLVHQLWWSGPDWLYLNQPEWPSQADSVQSLYSADEDPEICCHASTISNEQALFHLVRHSSFAHVKRITAWIKRFIFNSRSHKHNKGRRTSALTAQELHEAEMYWISLSQRASFPQEIYSLEKSGTVSNASSLLTLRPFLDSNGVLRVGGRESNSKSSYNNQHPVILNGRHRLARLIVHSEHLRLLHAGPTLLAASLCRKFHITRCRIVVRSVTRGCVACRRVSAKPRPPLLGQLPFERVTPDLVFDKIGIDYAGPVYVKYGYTRKPTIVKTYICVFVSLSVKAVHLELVSDLTTEAFIASLRRFVARRGKPSLIWSDHGSNFVGANRELKELFEFLKQEQTQGAVSDFCSMQGISWSFIPEHAPHFGGLWEAAVKSLKHHLKRVVADVKLTFEEFTTVLTQVEACLNSRPLVSVVNDDDGVEALTPGHFLIGRPLEALPDPSFSSKPLTLLRRWHLSQALTRHFWKRWSSEYLATLQKCAKWHRKNQNLSEGDVVVLREDGMTPTKWPIARVVKVHTGRDGIVRVVEVKTTTGIYTRPVTKVARLLPSEL